MCQFCHQHGDGKKWYLNAANYADDLLNDVRRRKFISGFSEGAGTEEAIPQLEKLSQAPAIVQSMMKPLFVRRMKRDHFGQVLPLEDVKEIFGFIGSIIRVPCICRHYTVGREVGYCYGIALSPDSDGIAGVVGEMDGSFMSGPDVSQFDRLTTD